MAAPAFDARNSVLETLQNAAVAVGNGTAILFDGYGPLTLDVSGTFVGTVSFEGSIDGGATYFGVGLAALATGTVAASATAAGTFAMPANTPPLSHFRARVSAYTSGSITAKSRKAARFGPT